jgi:predicted Zn-dependent protease
MNSTSRRLIMLISLAGMGSGCATNQITGRSQAMLFSDESAAQQSTQEYSKLMTEAAQKQTLDGDTYQLSRVQSIAKPLIAEAIKLRPKASDWQWDVHVLKSNDVNAWCMAGGKMAVYTGLLDKVQPSDDELAAVMGHEIAHALLSHQAEKMSRQMMQKIGLNAGMIAASMFGINLGGLGSLADMAATVAVQLPNSRDAESEADQIGVEIAAKAGFNPGAAVTLWEKMMKVSGSGVPEWFSTHPNPESRIAAMKIAAKKLIPVYEASLKAQSKPPVSVPATAASGFGQSLKKSGKLNATKI